MRAFDQMIGIFALKFGLNIYSFHLNEEIRRSNDEEKSYDRSR